MSIITIAAALFAFALGFGTCALWNRGEVTVMRAELQRLIDASRERDTAVDELRRAFAATRRVNFTSPAVTTRAELGSELRAAAANRRYGV